MMPNDLTREDSKRLRSKWQREEKCLGMEGDRPWAFCWHCKGDMTVAEELEFIENKDVCDACAGMLQMEAQEEIPRLLDLIEELASEIVFLHEHGHVAEHDRDYFLVKRARTLLPGKP
jgi:acetyl-CoA carboxylase beta subunit